jgi:hypothetical protein
MLPKISGTTQMGKNGQEDQDNEECSSSLILQEGCNYSNDMWRTGMLLKVQSKGSGMDRNG